MKRIVLTGGGTAGHVTPNLGLIPHLRATGYEIHYLGTAEGIERELVGNLPEVTYHTITAGKLRRYLDLKNLSDPFKVVKGAAQAGRLMGKIKPEVVFSKGGFVSVPVVLGAASHRVPVVLHESDLTPGLANKLCIPFAKKVLTSFPETARQLGDKGVYTGAPVRESLLQGDPARGRKIAGLAAGKPILLSMGGSQGAQAVNALLRQALPSLLPRYQVIHLCGKGNLDEALVNTRGYYQTEYASDELPHLMAAADMILSRAGSNSIFELLALQKPNLLVPLPLSASRGDQLDNARSFEQQGFSMVADQDSLTPGSLAAAVDALYAQRQRFAKAMAEAEGANGLMRIYEEILRCAKPRQ